MYYLRRFNNHDRKLHTIIVKFISTDWTYILAYGYGGGGAYEEFYGKFTYSEIENKMVGYYSNVIDPDDWEFEVEEMNSTQVFQKIDKQDKIVLINMKKNIWDKLVFFSEEEDFYVLHDENLKKMGSEVYCISENWDCDIVDWISNVYWGLSLTFDW